MRSCGWLTVWLAGGAVAFGAEATTSSAPAEATSSTDSARVVNIINFIRAVEPRLEVDLVKPVAEQLKLGRLHNLPTTYLLQYDALIDERFAGLLEREMLPIDEIGLWLEIVQPLVEHADMKWRGRFPWDWHSDVGFSVGYTPDERRKLIDVAMERFRKRFGKYPQSVGSWMIDAVTLAYLADRYGVVASCNCKDQAGTDGYTLWGGYWSGGYYPSRRNSLCPAQSEATQIPLPVFRMLGSDPIYQYDHNLGYHTQGVVSLEPSYVEAGGNPAWVRWFFDVNFTTPALALSYAQVGQENSFSWPAMEPGLKDQMALLAEWRASGKLRVETLADTGRWFKATFPTTPAAAVVAHKDWQDAGRHSIWYNARYYRGNLLWDAGELRFRDLQLFDEAYPERYLNTREDTPNARFDNLPIMDGFHWSTKEYLAGIRPVRFAPGSGSERLRTGTPLARQISPDTLQVTLPIESGGELQITFEPTVLTCRFTGVDGMTGLRLSWSPDKKPPILAVKPKSITFEQNGFRYDWRCEAGTFEPAGDTGIAIRGDGGLLRFPMQPGKPR